MIMKILLLTPHRKLACVFSCSSNDDIFYDFVRWMDKRRQVYMV